MIDPQRIVDEIRAFLMASDQSHNPRLEGLAREYQEACEEVNARLARCAQLIRQGLRAEAIHLAEAEPNLLTTLQTLDFQDRAAWLDLVGIYQLPAPPDLDHSVSEHLSAAYTEIDPLRNLLRKHRRLALARAPLRERLAVIRELARIDATNPIWDEDRRAYELARFKQIQAEAIEAARRGDDRATLALEQELREEPWASKPPQSLVQALNKSADRVRVEAARRELPAVEAELNDAFSALDGPRAKQAKARWIALAEASRLPDNHPDRDRVEPALIWLRTQEDREKKRRVYLGAVAALEQALDDNSSTVEQLERLHNTLGRAEQDVFDPPGHEALSQRFRTRVASLNLAAQRRRRLIGGAALAAVVLAGVTVLLVYRAVERSSAEQTAIEALDRVLASEQIEEIEALLDRLGKSRPALLQSPAVVARMGEVAKARTAESDRRRQFDDRRREAEEAPLAGAEPSALEAARRLARTEDEKRSIELLARKIDRRNRDRAAEIDLTLLPQLDQIGRSVDAIEARAGGDSRFGLELSAQISDAFKRLDAVLPKSGPLSELAKTRSDRLRERLKSVSNELDLVGRRNRAEAGLSMAVRQLPEKAEDYVAAAEALAVTFLGQPQEADIKKVIGPVERPVWRSALDCESRISEWLSDPRPLTPETALSRLEFCRGFLKENPRCPNADILEACIKYHEPISRRKEGESSLSARLVKVLSTGSIDPLYLVRVKSDLADGTILCWYSSNPVERSGTISNALFRVDSNGNEKARTLSGDMIVGPRELSPQTLVAREIKAAIKAGALRSGWDLESIGFARKLALNREIDPICQVLLIRAIIEIAAEGSLPLRQAVRPTLDVLVRGEDLRTVPWLDPEVALDRERDEARKIIADLPDWSKVIQNAAQIDRRLRRAWAEIPRPVGWLARHDGGWSVRFSQSGVAERVGNGSELVVALPGESASWIPLGTLLPGPAGAIKVEHPEAAATGRLVFLRTRVESRPDAVAGGSGR